MVAVNGQQQQQQQQHSPSAAPSGPTNLNTPSMGGFTPIRLIQPQTPEQQQAIQNLVDELRKSSPQLFSSIGQGNGQQVAIALPSTAPNAGSASPVSPGAPSSPGPAQAAQPQQPQQLQQPRAPEVPQAPQVPQASAPAGLPETPPATSSAPAGSAANTPAPAETEQSATNSDASTPFSFAVNAMFMSPDADDETVGEINEDQTIPFGLRFDPTSAELEETGSESSSIHRKHDSSSHSSDSDTDFDFFDDLSDLDSMATARAAVSLAAIGFSLLASMALSL
ncbi:hypothetical protein IW140_004825 [Coemansia sp. RSA 1813]|nr:hypothetical protein EV178_004844 [Coemansia sp. RSA 1646]KAJ1766988.1 hypothetical protein LPJ74_005615 [Coemansia sp. RSA 1843]KAJ2088815.1 hypothetical protein IW138_003887 [Coemansia sp. RSA 986]KAJ2212355.1 hypothetical protein EV179_004750 [Coemansia sp. RSA 487]KAJ2566702.1 hypothetical protein IW140_004825 [Coemansia sp. RSA 1813]